MDHPTQDCSNVHATSSHISVDPRLCCCMCGDVGFSADLRPCPACSRVQHTYCSRMYPKISEERWRCEWCLCSENQLQQQLTTTEAMTKKHKGGKRGVSFRLSPETGPDGVTATSAAVSSPQPSPKKPRQKRRGGDDILQEAAGRKDGRGSMSVTTPIGCDHRERWRNSSPSPRVVGRRYKLLADVHC